MRKRRTYGGLTVNAISGTHVVTLGLDLANSERSGCLGFAIRREDHTEAEVYWLKGMKTFRETDPMLGPGGQTSSREHPYQTFQWADYSAKPNHNYTYRVVPLYGTPAQLSEGTACSVTIGTEVEVAGRHSVIFNRGAIASQEYARRFQNKKPPDVGEPAYSWLSRGLLEALQAFVGRATDGHYGLYGAIYEFQWPAALASLKAASDRGADVKIIYDAIPSATGPKKKNETQIAAGGIGALCIPRSFGKIMHNKFIVLTRDDNPIAVWTGSTNLTENGIFGHSNCGHVVEDATIANAYLAFWNEIKDAPDLDAEKAWMGSRNPAPPNPWASDDTTVFSPRKGLKVLDWYAQIAGGAQKGLFMTFAFGMNQRFQKVFEENDGILRFALMEEEGNGTGLAQGKKDIARIRRLPNVLVAVGNNIKTNSFDRWLEELPQAAAHANVRYIHTKYMLVDPLGPKPVVVTGSGNFSEPSVNANHENMLVIRNDQRIADIYLGEFMRLYSHYAYREQVARNMAAGISDDWNPAYLSSDDSWQNDYFRPGHQRYLRRRYFAGY